MVCHKTGKLRTPIWKLWYFMWFLVGRLLSPTHFFPEEFPNVFWPVWGPATQRQLHVMGSTSFQFMGPVMGHVRKNCGVDHPALGTAWEHRVLLNLLFVVFGGDVSYLIQFFDFQLLRVLMGKKLPLWINWFIWNRFLAQSVLRNNNLIVLHKINKSPIFIVQLFYFIHFFIYIILRVLIGKNASLSINWFNWKLILGMKWHFERSESVDFWFCTCTGSQHIATKFSAQSETKKFWTQKNVKGYVHVFFWSKNFFVSDWAEIFAAPSWHCVLVINQKCAQTDNWKCHY